MPGLIGGPETQSGSLLLKSCREESNRIVMADSAGPCYHRFAMRVLRDHQGLSVRVTDERLAHTLERPEMGRLEGAIEEALTEPKRVLGSFNDPDARLYYRPEGDYLAVIFDQKPGYFRETASDQVMEKVDDHGNILGFSVLKVSSVREAPLEVAL